MIQVQGSSVRISTKTLEARFELGALVSLRPSGGPELVAGRAASPLELVFANGQIVGFPAGESTSILTRKLSETMAEFRFHGWSGDGVVRVGYCPESGDLLVEPSAYSNRAGLVGCRWNMAGIRTDLNLVAPFFQGINLPLSDALIRNSNWAWPHMWEAAFVVLQGKTHGFSIHARDTQYRPKAVKVGSADDPQMLGLDTQAFGPLDDNRAAGGLVWRIGVHGANWQTPVRQYRDWMIKAFDLQKRIDARPDWASEIRLAGCWMNTDMDMLDALASRIEPRKVLLHLSEWRNHGYDEYYPDFTPSDAARRYMAKARSMGFHVMPHCNSIDMDPSHPVFPLVRDFVYLDPINKTTAGWAWKKGWLPVPGSNKALVENRSSKVMVKVHPGLSMWRSILREEIEKAMSGLNTDAVFIDVTACTWNLHNALVENTTCSQGMLRLIDEIGEIPPGLAVGGEGLNEASAPGLTFTQAHLFRSHQTSIEGLERTAGTAVNALLFEGLTRTIGYSDLGGKTENSHLRMRVHHSLGAIPTFTRLSAEEIRKPNAAVAELFDLARA